MKLNNKRTVLVGLAFLSICAFWQMYDSVIPLMLTKTFHLHETYSGAIMAADNVLALFLLPFFGTLSDRTTAKTGKRTPYIVLGTAAAVILLNALPLIDNSYYAEPATGKMIAFVVLLGLLLIAMGTYRSPAVALMPDVTPKPLRSRANAIINLMGAVGGIIYLAVAAVMYPNSKVEENQRLEAEHPEWNLAEDDGSGHQVLPAAVKRSLAFLLASIALWFIGYNGITTWFTTYVDKVMGQGLGGASTCLLIATGGAIISYIPIGSLAHKVGRKRTILIGILLLAACFAACHFLTTAYSEINVIMFIVFALIGFAWAAINVNSLPMVVEMCKGSDIGKFTGYYYAASMAAQVVTPILAGFLMRNVSYKVLFPYAALFVMASFVTMTMVKHGDAAPEVKHGLEAFEDMED